MNEKIEGIVSGVMRDILEGGYRVRSPRRYLAEKSRGLCRQMTLIHPRDLLVLERLSRSFYFELKSKAPSKSAYFEPDDGNFLKGFEKSDTQYGSFASWRRFQKAIFGFADENKFIVVTDVASFYDFINFQHLRNIVASLAEGIRESVLDLLIHVLNGITWTPDFMPLSQVGMPQIETNATRVLANAMLYEVDRVCESSALGNYARFMDDIDLGVETIPQAKKIIRDIDLTLQSRQLRLNSAKTKILTRAEAYDHFCIKENHELSRIEKLIVKYPKSSRPSIMLISRYKSWMGRGGKGGPGKDSKFLRGSGSKIHKYLLRLIYESGRSVPDRDLLWLVRNDPSMRSSALRYLSRSTRGKSNLAALHDMIARGIFVDDESIVNIMGYLLHARLPKSQKTEEHIESICTTLRSAGGLGLLSSIYLASKYLSTPKIYAALISERSRIVGDYWLCRAVAGIAARFMGKTEWSSYREFVENLENDDAISVLAYLEDVAKSKKFSDSLRSYLVATNDTFPQRIFFPKVLVLLAASHNSETLKQVPKAFSAHPALHGDPYFRAMGFP